MRSKQATDDVSICIKRIISALEEREKKLLLDIEKARILKLASLKTRDEALRNSMVLLTETVDKLKRGIGISKLTANPTELTVIKDMACAEVRKRENIFFTGKIETLTFFCRFTGFDKLVNLSRHPRRIGSPSVDRTASFLTRLQTWVRSL